MFRKKRFITLFICVLIVSLIAAGCGAGDKAPAGPKEAEPVKWIANSVWPPNNLQSVALVEFADKIKAATNGLVVIDVQTGGALGYKGPELLKAVRDNLVPVSDMLTSGVAGDEPLCEIVTLPFLVKSFEEGRILNDIARPYFDKILEEKWNQKILYIAPWPTAGLWTKEKVESVADMKGLKTRTYDKNGALVVEATGGTPYPLPFSEVYSSLATGVINSVITSTPTAVDAKFWEVLKYYEPISVTMATDLVTINLKEFNKLDKETQDLMLSIAKEVEDNVWEQVALQDKEKEQLCIDNGMEKIQPSDEYLQELAEITENIRAEWLKTAPPEAQQIVDEFLKAVGR